MRAVFFGLRRRFYAACLSPLLLALAGPAAAALTASPLTWNVVGLDSNDVLAGPANFPIGYRICASGAASNGVVTVTWNWSTSNAFVNLRTGSAGGPGGPAMTVGPLASGACQDAYFDLELTRNASAYGTTRRYSLTIDDADPGSLVTPTREVYVERLVSQNRNFISSIRVGTSVATLTPATLGTSTQLLTGQTYFIELTGGTATQGYEQLATFASFANTVFRVLSVTTTFNADSSSYVSSPATSLYLDGCLWENEPSSPAYRSCLDVGKAGGSNVVVLYQVQILSGAGTSERLSTLFYDYSGSSYHYNADFGTDSLQLNILDPTQNSTISKQFIPASIPQGTESTLRITINNQNAFSVSGYAVTDNLPSGVILASTPAAATSGCGTPTVTATAGASSVAISNATIAAASTCTLTVKVTASTAGSYNNTIAAGQFTINGVSTGQSAAATLTVTTAPAAPAGCSPGATLAQWTFQGLATGDNYAPPASTALVSPATATAGGNYVGTGGVTGAHTTIATGSPVTDLEWDMDHVTVGATLVHAQQEFMQFAINTAGYASLNLSYEMDRSTNGPQTMSLFIDSSATPPVSGAGVTTYAVPASHTLFSNTYSTEINKTGTTYFRFYFYNAAIDNNGHYASLNDVTFTACGFPTLSKAFNPATTVPGQTSTLTFSVVNPNPSNTLNGISFTDSLPAGVVIATPNGVTNNGNCGSPTVTAPAAGSDISVSGGTIAGGATCTISVNVVAATAGARVNVSGQVTSTQTGTNTTSTGSGTATLTTVSPPTMTKVFAPNPVAVGSTSTLTLTVTNPNSVGRHDGRRDTGGVE